MAFPPPLPTRTAKAGDGIQPIKTRGPGFLELNPQATELLEVKGDAANARQTEQRSPIRRDTHWTRTSRPLGAHEWSRFAVADPAPAGAIAGHHLYQLPDAWRVWRNPMAADSGKLPASRWVRSFRLRFPLSAHLSSKPGARRPHHGVLHPGRVSARLFHRDFARALQNRSVNARRYSVLDQSPCPHLRVADLARTGWLVEPAGGDDRRGPARNAALSGTVRRGRRDGVRFPAVHRTAVVRLDGKTGLEHGRSRDGPWREPASRALARRAPSSAARSHRREPVGLSARDLLGGAKTALLGNAIQQQFGPSRDWPFGSAIATSALLLVVAGIWVHARSSERKGGA